MVVQKGKGELGLKYVGSIMMGLARVFDKAIDCALKEAKEILLIIKGENKIKVHVQNTKKQPKRSIEEIVACIDLRDVPVEEDKEFIALRALGNNSKVIDKK